jgi:hypothetical protein
MLNKWVEAVVDRMIPLGLFLAALAPIIFTIELAEWLAYGEWPGWTVEDGLLFAGIEKPLARFQATQFLLDLATDLPLAIGLYLTGIAVFLGAFKISPLEQ